MKKCGRTSTNIRPISKASTRRAKTGKCWRRRFALRLRANASTKRSLTGSRKRASGIASITGREHFNEQASETPSEYRHRSRCFHGGSGGGDDRGGANRLVPELREAEDHHRHG